MQNTLLTVLLQLAVIACMCQSKETLLVRANIGKPAEYMRQVRIFYQLNKRNTVEREDRYSFEERGETTKTGGERFSLEAKTIKPDLKMKEGPPAIVSIQTKINNKMIDDGGPDPMVAVGEKTILVGNTSWLKFFDKSNGNVLEETDLTSLFWRYLSPTIPGTSQPNPDFATNFYDLPNDIPLACTKSTPCGVSECPNGGYDDNDLPCGETDAIIENAGRITIGYDLRVFYQKEHKRFVIVAAIRNQSSAHNDCYNIDGKIDCKKYVIRLAAFAVSVSENPADGFYIYRTTENNVRDWPNLAVDQDYLVLSYKGGNASTNGKSVVTVFSFRQMKDGAGPSVDAFRIKQNDETDAPKGVTPVQNLLTNQYSQAFFFIENAGSEKIRIWYLKKPAVAADIFKNPPTQLVKAGEITIADAEFTGGAFAGATYYDNMLYTVSYQKMYPASGTKRIGYGLNVFQIPVVEQASGGYKAWKNISQGFKHSIFKSESHSFRNPSIAVDLLHNIVIQFVRIPRDSTSSEFPNIRYKVKLSHRPDWEYSQLAKSWDARHNETKKLVDFSWVAKDPFKLTHFWQSHIYKANGKTGTWVTQIDLGKF